MADGCDDPFQIDDLTRLVERGVVVAAASRYARTGQQVGGPWLKGTMSRLAGLSLHYLARVGTKDATNSFKAYSTDFVAAVGIESDRGFEIGIEMVAKARRYRQPVAEIPTIWLDRAFGQSNFKMRAWLPRYLHWYLFAFGPRLRSPAWTRLPFARASPSIGNDTRKGRREGPRHRVVRVHRRLCRRGAARQRATTSSASTTTRSTATSPRATTTTRDYRLVEGDARDVELMTELLRDCDHFIAGAALIGGISYFHAYAYDLLATNERIMAASCDAAIEAHRAGRLQKVTYMSSSMVFESTTTVAERRGRRAQGAAAAVVVRVPEAGRRVLRPRRVGPVRAAVHDRAAVQLRRHRRDARARRGRGAVRQRQARDEPRRSRPRAEGAQGPGPAAHPRRRHPGPPLHLRRRPRARASSWRWRATPRPQRGLQPLDGDVDDRAGARRADLAQDQGTRRPVPLRLATLPFEHDVQRRVPVGREGRADPRLRGDDTLDEILDEVIPWIDRRWPTG